MLFYLGAICDWLGVDCMGAVCDPKIHQRQCSGDPRLLLPAGHPQVFRASDTRGPESQGGGMDLPWLGAAVLGAQPGLD